MIDISFNVLGPLRVRHEGELLAMSGLKNRTVVSCLALHPEQPISIDRLLAAAWDGTPPRSAVHQVRKMVSALRLSVDEGWDLVTTSREGYLLRVGAEQSDLVRFSELYARAMSGPMTTDQDLADGYTALALWRGRPCEGSTPRGCADRIDELLQQHRVLLSKTFRAFAERGREDELIAILQAAAHLHGESVRPTLETAEAPGTVPALGPIEPAVPDTTEPATDAPSPPPDPSSRRCLPRDLTDFTGREADLDDLAARFTADGSRPVVATIHGMGGVGKTSFAVHLAHRIAARFPDGQLYVNLDGTSSAPGSSMADSLGTLLSQLGVPDAEVPVSAEGRLARWRSLTAERRVLLLLDDASHVEQIEALVPASTQCLCIVTSRVALSGIDGAHYLRLEVPTEDDCLQMLRRIVGANVVDAELDEARSLVRLVDSLPLALRLASARLTTREFCSVAELVECLTTSSRPLDELDAPGRSLIGQLDASLVSMESFDLERFLRLSLLPSPEIDEPAVAAATGLSTDQARQTCRRFADRALLERVGSGAYRMHPLLAQTAASHLADVLTRDDRRRVVAAALAYYRESMGMIGSARVSPSPGPPAALLFTTLTRAAVSARELDLEGEFGDLCLAWERPVSLYLDVEQQETVWRLAAEAATSHADPVTRGYLFLALSRSLWHRDAVEEGRSATAQALDEAEQADDDLLRVRSLVRASSFSWLAGEATEGLALLDRARHHLERCGVAVNETTRRQEALEIDSNDAALLVIAGEHERAAEISQQVMDSQDCDPRVTIMATITHAASLAALGRRGDALTVATSALSQANHVRSPYGRALALQQTADVLRLLEEPEAAVAAAREGRDAARSTGSVRILGELETFLDGVDEEDSVDPHEDVSSA